MSKYIKRRIGIGALFIMMVSIRDIETQGWNQNSSFHFLESGSIKVDQQKKSYDFTIKSAKVFATCNDINRLSKPLQSRVRKIFLPRYSETEFLDVCEKVLPKLSPSIARNIGAKVYGNNGDIRDCIQIGKLVQRNDGPEAIESIMNTLLKYGKEEGSQKE